MQGGFTGLLRNDNWGYYPCRDTTEGKVKLQGVGQAVFVPEKTLLGDAKWATPLREVQQLAATPVRRVLGSNDVSFEVKARLTGQYYQLNPVPLRNKINDNVSRFWKLIR